MAVFTLVILLTSIFITSIFTYAEEWGQDPPPQAGESYVKFEPKNGETQTNAGITVTFGSRSGDEYKTLSWTAIESIQVLRVYVKAGSEQGNGNSDGSNWYYYTNESYGTNLATLLDKGISHVSFYYIKKQEPEPVTLTIKKILLPSDGITDVSQDGQGFKINIKSGDKIVHYGSMSSGNSAGYQVVPGVYTIEEDFTGVDTKVYFFKKISVDGVDIQGNTITVGDKDANVIVYNEKKIAPKLTIEKTASPTVAKPGEEVTYSIKVTNIGNVDATDVIITENVPTGMVVNAGSVPGWLPGQEPNTYFYSIRNIPDGSFDTINFRATVDPNISEITTIINTASVNCKEDANPVEDSETITVDYPGEEELPVLAITKTADKNPVVIGDTLTYTISVTNNGGDATGVEIVETAPNGTTYSNESPVGWRLMPDGYHWTVGELKSGQSAATTFKLKVVENPENNISSITNIAKVNCTKATEWKTATVTVQVQLPERGSLTIHKVVEELTEADGWVRVDNDTNFYVDLYSMPGEIKVNESHIKIYGKEGGSAVLTDMPYGTYLVKEVDVPQGYTFFDIQDNKYGGTDTVTLSAENKDGVAVIVNRITPNQENQVGSVKVIKTIGPNKIPQKGVLFKLHVSASDIRTATTGADGIAIFAEVPAGTYTLEEIRPAVFNTTMTIEAPPALIAEIAAANSIQVTVQANSTKVVNVVNTPIVNRGETYDPGLKIKGYKFNDLDKDGRRDEGEPGLPNWTIQLWRNNVESITALTPLNIQVEPIATTTTDANGYYEFTGLGGGSYKVKEVQQSGWQPSRDPEQTVYLNGGYYTGEITPINLLDDVNFKKAMPNETTVFEAEGRIGLPGDRDYELALKTINPTTQIKAQKYIDGWKNFAEPQPFKLSLNHTGNAGNYTITINFEALGETVQTVLPNDYPNDIVIRTRAAEAGSGIIINNLKLNGEVINATSVAVNGVRDTDILLLPRLYFGVYSNFELTGEIMAYWDGNKVPERSELAFQIAVGDTIQSQTEFVDFGNYLQGTPPPPPPPPSPPDPPVVTGKPDLVVTKTDNGSVVSPGGLVEYYLTVENKGTAYAQDVKVYEMQPEGATFVTDSNPGWVLENGKYVYSLGLINVGEKKQAKFILKVNDPFPTGLEKILNNVEVKDNGTETATSDNKASDDTPVLIGKTVVVEPPVTPPTPPTPGETGTGDVPDLPFTGGAAEVELLFAGLGALLMGAGFVLKRK